MPEPMLIYWAEIMNRLSALSVGLIISSAVLLLILGLIYAMEDSREIRKKLVSAAKPVVIALVTAASLLLFIPDKQTMKDIMKSIVKAQSMYHFKA